MKIHFSTVSAALGCVLLASCYPYDESKQKPVAQNQAQKTVSSPDQQKVQEQRDKMKADKELKKKEQVKNTAEEPPVTSSPANESPKPPAEEKRPEYAVANKVPGKDGYVFSPYNNKLVDVRDIPSGTLVQDPTYTGAGKGYFRVP